MAIAKTVREWLRVVPLRFARAPHATDPTVEFGPPDANAPDPDDRGYMPAAEGAAALPVGLDDSLAEPAVPETRVRLIRQDMENAGALYVTSSAESVLRVTTPAAGAALANQQKMLIKFKARSAGSCFLRVHFGAANGPVVHQLSVVVNRLLDVVLAVHVPIINGAAHVDSGGAPVPAQSSRSDADIHDMVDEANAIYFPYGLRFQMTGAVDRGGPALSLANRGFVNDQTNEYATVTQHHRVANAVNVYFVPQLGAVAEADLVGGSATSSVRNPNSFASLVADSAAGGRTLAHELGHVLNLVNDQRRRFIHVNTVADPARPGTGRDVRDDIVSRRRLMWAYTNLTPNVDMPYRGNVGYDVGEPGSMLTLKQYDADPTDLEMQEVRSAAARLIGSAGP